MDASTKCNRRKRAGPTSDRSPTLGRRTCLHVAIRSDLAAAERHRLRRTRSREASAPARNRKSTMRAALLKLAISSVDPYSPCVEAATEVRTLIEPGGIHALAVMGSATVKVREAVSSGPCAILQRAAAGRIGIPSRRVTPHHASRITTDVRHFQLSPDSDSARFAAM